MTKKHLLISFGIIALAAIVLLTMGRLPFCKCGLISIWSGDVVSSEQSQQLTDPYTFTHVVHGLAFYLILWLAFGRRFSAGQRLLLAVGLESAWEILENTDFVINRYREATISLDYYGDSIFNSVGDILAMMAGFVVAWKLPWWGGLLVFLAIELLLLFFIHDNLTINIIMLVHPVEAIKTWQTNLWQAH